MISIEDGSNQWPSTGHLFTFQPVLSPLPLGGKDVHPPTPKRRRDERIEMANVRAVHGWLLARQLLWHSAYWLLGLITRTKNARDLRPIVPNPLAHSHKLAYTIRRYFEPARDWTLHMPMGTCFSEPAVRQGCTMAPPLIIVIPALNVNLRHVA